MRRLGGSHVQAGVPSCVRESSVLPLLPLSHRATSFRAVVTCFRIDPGHVSTPVAKLVTVLRFGCWKLRGGGLLSPFPPHETYRARSSRVGSPPHRGHASCPTLLPSQEPSQRHFVICSRCSSGQSTFLYDHGESSWGHLARSTEKTVGISSLYIPLSIEAGKTLAADVKT